MMSVMVHQPEYLPWINLFFKAALSDSFVLLDTVQYVKRSFQNRNKIKTKHGVKWLTVPLKYAAREEIVEKMKIDNSQDWRKKHLETIRGSYSRAQYYGEILPFVEPAFLCEWEGLSGLNSNLTAAISKGLGLNTRFVKSSELGVEGTGSERILNICLKVRAARYISGIGAKAYLDEETFKQNNIDIIYLPPAQLEYAQLYPELGFIPDLSIIDYLFNSGIENFRIAARKYVNNAGIEYGKIKINA